MSEKENRTGRQTDNGELNMWSFGAINKDWMIPNKEVTLFGSNLTGALNAVLRIDCRGQRYMQTEQLGSLYFHLSQRDLLVIWTTRVVAVVVRRTS